MNLKRLIRLDFIPFAPDCGLLLLRVWLGLSMLLLHGMTKVKAFSGTIDQFTSMGMPKVLAICAILTESVAAGLLVIGFATRWAALALTIAMSIAFFQVHKMILVGEGSGEMAFIYLAGYAAILIAGPGRWSVDAKLGR